MSTIVVPRFIPYLRTGLATHIKESATNGLATASTAMLTVAVQLRATGDDDAVTVITSPDIAMLGPGHVTGLDSAQIVRQDPVSGALDAETNYFTLVELASADLPWRFTPAAVAAGDDRLQPWLVLVVVRDRQEVTLEARTAGLDVLRIDEIADEELPDLAESWAWAHVHADVDLDDADAATVAAAYQASPSSFRARLVAPRLLDPQTSWIAALVPAFESGRATGLGVAARGGRLLAWLPGEHDVELPVYHSWRFQTGASGDFESLVKRLVPRALSADVGRRTLALDNPGGGLPEDPAAATVYSGALVSPAEMLPTSNAGLNHIIDEMPRILNTTVTRKTIPDAYQALRHDPVVGPSVYCSYQTGARRVPARVDDDHWFAQVNLEPHHRASAGLGAEIVRRDQETLMATAWEQLESLTSVNELLVRARAAWEIAAVMEVKVRTLDDGQLVQFASPAASRLRLAGGTTFASAVKTAPMPNGLLSTAFRRVCTSTPSLAKRQTGKPRVYPTVAVTEQCLSDPVAFAKRFATGLLIEGADPADDVKFQGHVDYVVGEIQRQFVSAPTPRTTRARARAGLPDVSIDRDVPILDGPIVASSLPLATRLRNAIDPQSAIVAMLDTRISGLQPQRAHPAPSRLTAGPTFTTPMYARLAKLSAEFVMPGVGTIPDDTVALAETNPQFVEAFLAGLNNEIGREFLWREYPTRLDETWFRRFWSSVDGSDDITAIDTWIKSVGLGLHRPTTSPQASLVLLVTGALLRRYPDTNIYAVEAKWQGGLRREKTGKNAIVKMPVFTGRLGPGVHFFGFELDDVEARGSLDRDEHPGYFFALEEPAHAPRFGFDEPDPALVGKPPATWADMSWSHLSGSPDDPPTNYVDLDTPIDLSGVEPGTARWADNSAAMARIALQQPVRMLVHAGSMLPAKHRIPRFDPDNLPNPRDIPHEFPTGPPTPPFGPAGTAPRKVPATKKAAPTRTATRPKRTPPATTKRGAPRDRPDGGSR